MQDESGIMEAVCAVMVTYYPDTLVAERISRLRSQVDFVIVVDNTPEHAKMMGFSHLLEDERFKLVSNLSNIGLAAGLNQGLRHAAASRCRWLLTLDQDSDFYPEMKQTLLQVVDAVSERPAVIGSNYWDGRTQRFKVPTGLAGEYWSQKTVITSGSLMDVAFAEMLGGFREDYFIDQVDHEFCLRVRANGGQVIISRKPVMSHTVGESGGAWLPVLGTLPNHSPLRKYFIARNSIATIARYWHTDPEWCLRRLMRLLLGFVLMAILERRRLAKVSAFVAGVADGLRKRMGPCRHEWLCHLPKWD